DALHIKHEERDMYEAGDIIGTLASEADGDNWVVKVISGDQDLLRLGTDHVTVALTKIGVREVESYTRSHLKEKMELTPGPIIDLKALMGDSSDNSPGVPGVGVKTATKLLKEYGTVANGYENLDKISGKKLKENLTTYKEDAFMSRNLATINQTSPIEIALNVLSYEGYEYSDIHELFSELEFRQLLDRIHSEIGGEKPEEEFAAFEY